MVVIIAAMLYRLSLIAQWLVLSAICLMLFTYSSPRSVSEADHVRAYTRDIEFDYISWMLNAVRLKIQQGAAGAPGYLSRESSIVAVTDYVHVTQQVIQNEDALNRIYADASVTDKAKASAQIRSQLNALYKEQEALAPMAALAGYAVTVVDPRRSFATYAVLTLLAVVVLWGMGLPLLTALTHAMSAVSTGGFSSFDASLAAVPGWPLRFAVMAFAFLGAVGLPLYYRVYRQGWRSIMGDEELRALVLATLIVSMLLAFFMHHTGGESRMTVAGNALLMGMSAQTTTGFSSVPVAALDNASKLVLIASMAVGGSVGSTAGGIKLLRLLLLWRLLQLVIRRAAMPPHAVAELRFGGRVVESPELVRALLPVTLFVVVVLVSWLPFLALGYEPLNALFEVVSATGTVGLSSGITAPDLPPLLKGVLCAWMPTASPQGWVDAPLGMAGPEPASPQLNSYQIISSAPRAAARPRRSARAGARAPRPRPGPKMRS